MRGKIDISRLFNQGSRVKGGSLLMIYNAVERSEGDAVRPMVTVLFTVGKKAVPRAVDRNRIKRLLREAYRLEKGVLSALIDPDNSRKVAHYFVALLYRGKADVIPPLDGFRDEIRRLLHKLVMKRVYQPHDGGRVG